VRTVGASNGLADTSSKDIPPFPRRKTSRANPVQCCSTRQKKTIPWTIFFPRKGGGKPRYRGFRFLRTCGAAGGVFCWLGFPNHPRCFFQIFLFFRPPRLQVDIFVDFSWAMVLLVAFWFFFGPPIFSLTVWFSCLFQVSCSFYFPDLRRRTSKFHPVFARNFLLNCFSYDFYPFFLIFPWPVASSTNVTCEVVFADQPIYFGRAAQVKKNHTRFVPAMFTLVPMFVTFFQKIWKSDNFPIFFWDRTRFTSRFVGLRTPCFPSFLRSDVYH